jgi:DNA-directed RNA polymerase sigma subunit (sigma70/sigma32)
MLSMAARKKTLAKPDRNRLARANGKAKLIKLPLRAQTPGKRLSAKDSAPPTAPDVVIPPYEELIAPIIARERAAYDGDSAIKLYLREIGQVRLLTPLEEIQLAARIKKGDKKAREQMIKANLRLVVKSASTPPRAANSPPTAHGGSSSPSNARSPTNPKPSACPSISWTKFPGCAAPP